MITQKYLKQLLHYNPETGIFRWRINKGTAKVGDVAGYISEDGYVCIGIQRKYYRAHRLAWLYTHGQFPKGEMDHINHKRDDNRISNLRETIGIENRKNLSVRMNNTSGIPGVCWSKLDKKWMAYIHTGGKRKHLGLFTDIDEAKKARELAKVKYNFHPNHA